MTAVVLAVAVTVTGCGLNPVRMPVPDFGGAKKLGVVIEFSSVLNLPAGSRVAYQGVDVGVVRGVHLGNGVVRVNADVDATAGIAENASAAIVQDTVLGDSYIRLAKPADAPAAPPLASGSIIPVARTLPPTSVEDMMSTLSSFLGTGSLQQLQSMLRRLNHAMPSEPARLHQDASTLAADLRSLAVHGDQIDRTLSNVKDLATVLRDRRVYLDDYLTDRSQQFWSIIPRAVTSLLVLIGGAGSFIGQGYWLIPVFDSVATAFEQVGVPGMRDFVNQTLLPFALDPRVNITSVTGAEGTDRTADTQMLLRQLGAIR
ncbi:Mce family protein [Mycobacteroides abscessus subsp. abscessus]|nr:Mce family protein [Mycobacteroides abscessus subsp. abscessus]